MSKKGDWTVTGPSRQKTIPLSLWLWMHYRHKKTIDGFSIVENVNIRAEVKKGTQARIKISLLKDDSKTDILNKVANQMDALIDKQKRYTPDCRDVSQFSICAEATVSKSKTQSQCFTDQGPDGKLYIIGPNNIKVQEMYKKIETEFKELRKKKKASIPELPLNEKEPEKTMEVRKEPSPKQELIMNKKIWIYISEVCAKEVEKATTSRYQISVEDWGTQSRLILKPRDQNVNQIYDRLEKIVLSYEGEIVSEVITPADPKNALKIKNMIKKKEIKKCYIEEEEGSFTLLAKKGDMTGIKLQIKKQFGLLDSAEIKPALKDAPNKDKNATSKTEDRENLASKVNDDDENFILEPIETNRFMWMFLNQCRSVELKAAVTPHKAKASKYDSNKMQILLKPISGSSGKSIKIGMTKLKKLMRDMEEVIAYDVIPCRDQTLCRKVEELELEDKSAFVFTEEGSIHIMAKKSNIKKLRQKIETLISDSKTTSNLTETSSKNDIKNIEETNATDFIYKEKTTIHIFKEDITTLYVDTIVNAANDSLAHHGGIAKAIANAAGPELNKECAARITKGGKLKVSGTFVSKGYNLPARSVIHAVGPMWKDYKDKDECAKVLQKAFSNCLQEAEHMNAKTIAIPAISSGLFRVPVDIVAEQLFQAVTEHLKKTSKTSLTGISIVDFNREFLQCIREMFNDRTSDKDLVPVTAGDRSTQRPTTSKDRENSSEKGQPTGSTVKEGNTGDEDVICTICMSVIDEPRQLECGHLFCVDCIESWEKQKPSCPMCGHIFGKIIGNQPLDGSMSEHYLPHKLPGYEKSSQGTIEITYTFPPGVQTAEHPNPGARYRGTRRVAYLPRSEEGDHVMRLLHRAFRQRLTFTVGRSSTSAREDQITWNDIHHKTNRMGGPDMFGYPDLNYLHRVQEELAAKGIK